MENKEENKEKKEETLEMKPDIEVPAAASPKAEDPSVSSQSGKRAEEEANLPKKTADLAEKGGKRKKRGPLPALVFILLLLVLNGVFVVAAVDYLLQNKYKDGTIQNVKSVEVVDEQSEGINVAKNASSAVVSIIATAEVPKYETYYRNFFNFQIPIQEQNGTEQQQIGAGSGFIVSDDGYIVTNKHVVSEEDATYTVILKDAQHMDEKIEARVVARDPNNDIAILKIEKTGLPYLNLGDSDSLSVGQTTVAIGYALGEFDNTVSKGIVSGLSRSITASDMQGEMEELENLIQTDAAVNSGNSGGPLLDIKGNVIGVNVAMADAENIGFAIPINYVKKVYEEAKTSGTLKKEATAYLGVRYVNIDSSIQKANNLAYDYGVIITRGEKKTDLAVIPGSPADKAGLVENDIILEVNGTKIDNKDNTLAKMIGKLKPGDEVKLKVYHRGEEKEIAVTLGESQ